MRNLMGLSCISIFLIGCSSSYPYPCKENVQIGDTRDMVHQKCGKPFNHIEGEIASVETLFGGGLDAYVYNKEHFIIIEYTPFTDVVGKVTNVGLEKEVKK